MNSGDCGTPKVAVLARIIARNGLLPVQARKEGFLGVSTTNDFTEALLQPAESDVDL